MFFRRNKNSRPAAATATVNNQKPVTYITPTGQYYKPFLTMVSNNHLLVAGATGSGKSVAINGIITSLVMVDSPYNVQFIFIDPKRVELQQYERLPHCVYYADNKADIIKGLTMAVIEMERRFAIMKSRGEKTFTGSKLYIVVDELSDIMTSYKKECFPLLLKLAQLGRAAKCFLICASQTVLAKIITSEFRCNFPVILGLRTATAQQSRMLIDCNGCEQLPDPKATGKGQGIIKDGADTFNVDIYKYPDSEITRVINYWTSKACIA